MILIAHRGNLNGPNPSRENSPSYINEALDKGFYVEIDVWLQYDENTKTQRLFLGHDEPQYETALDYIKHNKKIICHAKTVPTFQFLLENGLHCFFHDTDPATLTSQNKIWLYPGVAPCPLGILVMPEWSSIDYKGEKWLDFVIKSAQSCHGVCSDYVEIIRKALF
jgi:hypothetical protein